MDKNYKSSFQFNDYKLQHVEFTYNPDCSSQDSIELTFAINVSVSIKDVNDAIITLEAIIFDDAKKNNYPFTLKVAISGHFSIDGEQLFTSDEFLAYCKLNGVTVMFPFLRSVIADITKAANIDTLILPLMNISSMLDEKNTIDK